MSYPISQRNHIIQLGFINHTRIRLFVILTSVVPVETLQLSIV